MAASAVLKSPLSVELVFTWSENGRNPVDGLAFSSTRRACTLARAHLAEERNSAAVRSRGRRFALIIYSGRLYPKFGSFVAAGSTRLTRVPRGNRATSGIVTRDLDAG